MIDDLVKRLRYGIVEHRKRWSGDTHADLGGSVDYDATTDMLHEAADRIEELEAKLAGAVAECERIGRLWHDAEAKLAKAVEALRKLNRRQDCLETFDAVVDEIVTAALAELKGEDRG